MAARERKSDSEMVVSLLKLLGEHDKLPCRQSSLNLGSKAAPNPSLRVQRANQPQAAKSLIAFGF